MSKIDRFLKTGERILWRGKPVKAAFVFGGATSIPFGLIFLAFAITLVISTASTGAPMFFTLFALPIVLVGIGVTFGPSIWQLLRYRNTVYVITNQRVITQTGAIGLDTRFVDFSKIQEVYVKVGITDRIFGTGSVYVLTAGLSSFVPPVRYGYGSHFGLRPSLGALREPYKVQKILQEAIENKSFIN